MGALFAVAGTKSRAPPSAFGTFPRCAEEGKLLPHQRSPGLLKCTLLRSLPLQRGETLAGLPMFAADTARRASHRDVVSTRSPLAGDAADLDLDLAIPDSRIPSKGIARSRAMLLILILQIPNPDSRTRHSVGPLVVEASIRLCEDSNQRFAGSWWFHGRRIGGDMDHTGGFARRRTNGPADSW